MPLYSAGLCEAVSIAPGASKWPAAKKSRSVEARPRSTTSTPWPVTPRAKAAGEVEPRGAHVAGDEHPVGRRRRRRRAKRGEGGADGLDELGVELVGHVPRTS